jgi:hypothetical protein
MPPRAKKKKDDDVVYFTEEELRDMTPEQKLQRIKGLESEIDGFKARLKDEAASTRDYIKESRAKIAALLESVPKQ